MKTSMQFFKDMGVCDGAYAFLEKHFIDNGYETHDYLEGYNLLETLPEFYTAAQAGGPEHDTVAGWLEWAYDLRNRPEAIMYFGDHIEKNTYKCPDNLLHMSRAEAEASIDVGIDELKAGYAANHAIVGIKESDEGEQWVVLRELDTVDWAEYDKFSWTAMHSGERFVTPSATEALAHYTYMTGFYDQLEALKETQKASIKRLIADNSDTYEVWV